MLKKNRKYEKSVKTSFKSITIKSNQSKCNWMVHLDPRLVSRVKLVSNLYPLSLAARIEIIF